MTLTVGTPTRTRRVHSGRIVATEVAVALPLAAWPYGAGMLAGAAVAGAVLVSAVWVRWRGRRLGRWSVVALAHLGRRRVLVAGADPGRLLAWLNPGAVLLGGECDGTPAGVIEDVGGRSVLLELGDPAAPLPAAATTLPALPVPREVDLHLVICGAPAGVGAGLPAGSYRQLTDGRVPSRQRVVLAVRVRRRCGLPSDTDRPSSADRPSAGGAVDVDLHPALTSAVRRIRRRLDGTTGARILSPQAAAEAIADLAQHDGSAAREHWQELRLGGLRQACYRLNGWPDPSTTGALLKEIFTVPAAATTIGVMLGTDRRSVPVARLAAPDTAALEAAGQALGRIMASVGGQAVRLDGEQLPALAATLPTGVIHSGRSTTGSAFPATIGGAGLVVGVNRHGNPVAVRLLRAEPTRALMVGGLPAAQLIAVRALATGARVVVHSSRPAAWEPFARAVSASADAVTILAPGPATPVLAVPGTSSHPQLVLVDLGRPGHYDDTTPAAWRTVLLLRSRLTAADTDALSRADLAVLQPLTEQEAATAADALGLQAATRQWLARIGGDMVSVLHRRTVRWATFAPTRTEQQLLGPLTRSAPEGD